MSPDPLTRGPLPVPVAPLPVSPLGRIEPGPIALSIEQAVTAALKTVPGDKRGALLAVATTEGARAVVAAKLGEDWKLAGWVGKDWQGPVEAGVAVMGTW